MKMRHFKMKKGGRVRRETSLHEHVARDDVRAHLESNSYLIKLMLFLMPLEIPFQRFVFADKSISKRIAYFRLLFTLWIFIKLSITIIFADCQHNLVRALLYDWTIYYPFSSRLNLVRAYLGMCAFHLCAKASAFVLDNKSWNASLLDYLMSLPPPETKTDIDDLHSTTSSDNYVDQFGRPKSLKVGQRKSIPRARNINNHRHNKPDKVRASIPLGPNPDFNPILSHEDKRSSLRDRHHWLAMSVALRAALRRTMKLVLVPCLFVTISASLRMGYFLSSERSCDIEVPLLRLVGLLELNFLFFETMMTFVGTFSYIIMVRDDLLLQASRVEEHLDWLLARLNWRHIRSKMVANNNLGGPEVDLFVPGEGPTKSLLSKTSSSAASTNSSQHSLANSNSSFSSKRMILDSNFATSSRLGYLTSAYNNEQANPISSIPQTPPNHMLLPSYHLKQPAEMMEDPSHSPGAYAYLEPPQSMIYQRSMLPARSRLTKLVMRDHRQRGLFVPDLKLVDQLEASQSDHVDIMALQSGLQVTGEPESATSFAKRSRLAYEIRLAQQQAIAFFRCIDSHQQPISYIGCVILIWLCMGLSLVPVLVRAWNAGNKRSNIIYGISCLTPLFMSLAFTYIGAAVYHQANLIAQKVFRLCSLNLDRRQLAKWNKIIFIWYVPNRCALKIGGAIGLTYLNILKSISFLISGLTIILNNL